MGRGLLVFKGDKPKKKRKKSKHDRTDNEAAESSSEPAAAAASAAANTTAAATTVIPEATESTRKPAAVSSRPAAPKIHAGRGKITTSGTVVTGHNDTTKFTKDLRQGDALLVKIGGAQEEMRVITMLLSDISINLSSPFSQNLMQPTSYRYIPKPRNTQREAKQARDKASREAVEEEAKASGTGSAQELVYRERTSHGSYRIRRKQLDSELSREELLNMRSKKTSDKYC